MAYSDNTFSPTIYSGFVLYNPNSKIDKTCMNFSMWKTTLKISIIPLIESEIGNEGTKYDYKNSISIFLTPIKAHIFAQILQAFKQDPEKYNNYGISTPQSIITVDTPKVFGKDYPGAVISIRRVNEEGITEASYAYECSSDNFSAIVGFNSKNPKEFTQDTELFKNEEIDAIIKQLTEYYTAMTNAQSFSTINALYPYLDKIASKMGVDLSGNTRKTTSSGFFSNNTNTTASNIAASPTIGQMGSMPNMPNMGTGYNANQLQNLVSTN